MNEIYIYWLHNSRLPVFSGSSTIVLSMLEYKNIYTNANTKLNTTFVFVFVFDLFSDILWLNTNCNTMDCHTI